MANLTWWCIFYTPYDQTVDRWQTSPTNCNQPASGRQPQGSPAHIYRKDVVTQKNSENVIFSQNHTEINSDDWTITKKTTRTIKHENFSKMKILKVDRWALSLSTTSIQFRYTCLPTWPWDKCRFSWFSFSGSRCQFTYCKFVKELNLTQLGLDVLMAYNKVVNLLFWKIATQVRHQLTHYQLSASVTVQLSAHVPTDFVRPGFRTDYPYCNGSMGSILLMIVCSQFKFCEISYFSYDSNSSHQVTIIFHTFHNSTAIVACTYFCNDHMARIDRIWISMENR